MISQTDIIRSLVNKNCTDESIMATALSADCTLPKLLQKFTEAERFDLALDVYMKLGMDVVPLWKTWAMRCLRNRNFQGARDKFKHCFQRSRSSAGRFGAATNVLLQDILSELIRMEETKLPLGQEIELIKTRRNSDRKFSTTNKITETKPKIFNECMHYLKEYGTVELLVKFYVDNGLWSKAIRTIFEKTNDNRYHEVRHFISDVIVPAETRGHLDQVLVELMKLDPAINTTSRYFRSIYAHYVRRHNSLYYIQHEIGDFVAAAENQVRNFFLKKPVHDYKELNQRLPSLLNASEDYKLHIERLRGNATSPPVGEQTGFFAQLSLETTESKLKTIDTQIEITRNFAINEVPGCINGLEVVFKRADVVPPTLDQHHEDEIDLGDDSPVTLFDTNPRRQTFLAALILIYFDLDCSKYLSDSGFELANKLINESDLDKLSVFKTAMHIIIEDESSDIIENATLLLRRLRNDYIACTQRSKLKSPASATKRPSTGGISTGSNSSAVSKNVISRPIESERVVATRRRESLAHSPPSSSPRTTSSRSRKKVYTFEPSNKSVKPGSEEAAQMLCDQVIRDSIKSCREEDYKMELAKLLSPVAKIELNLELGKLSIAQRLAFDMERRDYVTMVLAEAERLNQDHVKDVCQHWLAKH